MYIQMLKSKIHRATVVQAELNYVGSITIDEELMEKANIREYEKVQIANVDNGARFETYAIAGSRNSGLICLNGAAARQASVGDKIIIMAYVYLTADEAETNPPQVVFVTEDNEIERVTQYEKHGRLQEVLN